MKVHAKSNEDVFEKMSVGEAVRTMAVPAVAAQLIVLIYNLADTFYVGRTNNPFMVAGVSLILPLFNVAVAVGALFGAGGGALLPRLLAVDRKDEATRVSAYCLRLGLLTAAAFALLILLFMRPLLHLLGAGENTFGYARQYVLMVLVLGGIPTICSNVLSNLIRSLGLSRESGIGVALGGVLNLALDPLFMFVILPKGCEVLGVGIATLLSGIISCAYCLFVFRKKQKVIGVNLTAPLPETESRRKVFLVGIPSSIGGLLFDLDYMVLDKLMSGYGDIPLAAIGIVLKAERLPQQTGIGLCQAMVPLVAYSYAQRDFRRVRRIMARILGIGLAMALISITVYELFPHQIMRLFIADPATLEIGVKFLRIRSLAAGIMFFCFFVVFLYQAIGNGVMSMALVVLRWLVLNIPMLFLLNRLMGMVGLVWSQVISDVISVILSYAILAKSMKSWQSEADREGERIGQ